MHTSNYTYYQDGQELQGFLAYDENYGQPRPAVLVAHDWSGRNEFACKKAKMLAEMGYVGFAIDMYGEARLAQTVEEKTRCIEPFIQDRVLLRERILAAFNAVAGLAQVDSKRIAAIGFCFGGLCVLDLARSGTDLKGVVSFHGLLNKSENLPNEAISAKILVLHGYDDPMVRPEQVHAFCQEMTAAQADWQVHIYGSTQHAFANPEAHDKQLGTIYNARAERRALQAMGNFLAELFVY